MKASRALVASLSALSIALTAAACGSSTDTGAAASSAPAATSTSTSAGPRPLSSYLLTKDQFPPKSTFSDHAKLMESLKSTGEPSSEACKAPFHATAVTSPDSDAISGFPRSGYSITQAVSRQLYDLKLVSARYSPPCSPVRSALADGRSVLTTAKAVPTKIPGAVSYAITATLEDTGEVYADSRAVWLNRDDVGVVISMVSRPGRTDPPGTPVAPIDPAEFDKYVALAMAHVDGK